MDTREPAVRYNYGGKTRKDENQEAHQEVEREGLRRQSVDRLIWLDQEIRTTNTPHDTSAYILGVFDVNTRHSMIHVVIVHKSTEYRVTRYDREILPIITADIHDLRRAHRNMVKFFVEAHAGKDFQVLLNQWLAWNKNQSYDKVLGTLRREQPFPHWVP